jgi:hypothetical protein
MPKKPGKNKAGKTPPEPTKEEIAAWAAILFRPVETRSPLLRYPLKEGPLYQGSRRWK